MNRTHTIADLTLGLSAQALAVLQLLAQTECDGLAEYDSEHHEYKIEIRTRAWYNGRERGISLEVRPSVTSVRGLIVTFGEHRTSDHIFIDSWETDQPYLLNPPTVADCPWDGEGYERRMVHYGEVVKAVDCIRERIARFITACAAAEAEAESERQ